MPEDLPDRMPEDMSDRMPEDLPVRKCKNVTVGITRSKVIFVNTPFSDTPNCIDNWLNPYLFHAVSWLNSYKLMCPFP